MLNCWHCECMLPESQWFKGDDVCRECKATGKCASDVTQVCNCPA